jgi:hypothetical protein
MMPLNPSQWLLQRETSPLISTVINIICIFISFIFHKVSKALLIPEGCLDGWDVGCLEGWLDGCVEGWEVGCEDGRISACWGGLDDACIDGWPVVRNNQKKCVNFNHNNHICCHNSDWGDSNYHNGYKASKWQWTTSIIT